MAHLGGILSRGVGLTCVEATAVAPEGRISPEDSGLWEDAQIAPLRKIVDFAHSQNEKIIIQLAHAGRKGSTVAPWIGNELAPAEVGGWPDDVIAPSDIAYNSDFPQPKAMTLERIEKFKQQFVAAVKRAMTAGFDGIEIHNAHGYLLHEFLSGASNKRTDKYGGSFENRTRLTLEIVDLVRATVPKDFPVFLRISATDWLENDEDKELAAASWKLEDTVRLAPLLAERGVDLLDVSTGGMHPNQKFKFDGLPPKHGKAYQSPFAFEIKKAVGDKMLVGSVGSIDTGTVAEQLLQDGLDLIIVGRAFQKNPGLVFAFADELKVTSQMPNQIRWVFQGGRKTKSKK
jgi:2,4-dienoyl-CoA reductase-like NADH-dependent reductase (Old Yellow Enzyme family)